MWTNFPLRIVGLDRLVSHVCRRLWLGALQPSERVPLQLAEFEIHAHYAACQPFTAPPTQSYQWRSNSVTLMLAVAATPRLHMGVVDDC